MLKKFGFILSLFIFCKSLDIIPISNSGKKEIHFTKKKKYFVFEYKNSEGGKYSKVNIIKSQQNNRSHYVYIYLNKSNIDEKFSNYYSKGNFDNSIYSIDINEFLKNKFYIVISQPNEIVQNILLNSQQGDVFYLEEETKIDEIQIQNLSSTLQKLNQENDTNPSIFRLTRKTDRGIIRPTGGKVFRSPIS